MSEKTKNHNRSKFSPKRIAAAAVATVVIPVGAHIANSGSPESRRNDKEAKILDKEANKGFEVLNALYVFERGTQYRKTPDIVRSDTGDGSDSGSVAGKVEKDKLLVVSRPFVHNDEAGTRWLGFKMKTEPNTGNKVSNEKLADQTYWIDMSTLSTQHDKAGLPYYEIYASGSTENDSPTVQAPMTKQVISLLTMMAPAHWPDRRPLWMPIKQNFY
jgi:hypothetical protein